MDDLLAWLTLCLDNMEAVAVAGSRSDATTWSVREHKSDPYIVHDGDYAIVYDEGSPTDEQAAHIALNDPRAVLARVVAERALVTAYTMPDLDPAVMADVLRLIAHGHRFDYPGHREEWAPERSAA